MEINLDDYDIDAIRDYLEDYYGTAMTNVSPFATVNLIDVSNKTDSEIIVIAYKMGILNNFYKRNTR